MAKNTSRRSGFTIIELILVIGVVSLMAAVAVPNYFGARQKRSLISETDKIAAEVRGAAERSRSQQDNKQWWVRFENPTGTGNDFYTLCGGTYSGTPGASCAAEGGAEFSRKTLNTDTSFTNPGEAATKRIIFARGTGLPASADKIILSAGSLKGIVAISSNGLVDGGNYWEFGYVGYWSLNDASGTKANDASTNNNDGTLQNGPVWTVAGSCQIGGCLSFDGTNDYVSLASAIPTNGLSGATVAAWVYANSVGGGVFRSIVGDTLDILTLFANSTDGKLRFKVRSSSNNVTAPNVFPTGQWVHVAGTYDGTTLSLYQQGQLVNSAAASVTGLFAANSTVGIGAQQNGTEFWSGLIDDVRIYDAALSAAEISALYGSGL